MKSILSYSTSLLLAAGLSSALPAPQASNQNTVTINIKSGDGDSASTLSAGIGSVTLTQTNNAQSVASSLFQSNVFCGGFKDAAATNLWLNFDGTDAIFSSGKDAKYSINSDGGTGSNPDDAITVASYFCANTLAGVQSRITARTLPPKASTSGGNAPPPPSTTSSTPPPPPPSNTGSTATALIQIAIDNTDGAIQRAIPINNQQTLLNTPVFGLTFVSTAGLPSDISCQAFNGNAPVGTPLTSNGSGGVSGGQQISAITCSSASLSRASGQSNAGSAPPASNNAGTSGSGSAVVFLTVETESQTTFVQEQITANGQPQATRNNAAISISVQTVEGGNAATVKCQVLSGDKKIADFTALDPAVLSTSSSAVKFDQISCTV